MKIRNYLFIILASLLVISCSKVSDPIKKIGLGNRVLNYQADEKVSDLLIPPDLTKPNTQELLTEVSESGNIDINGINSNVKLVRDNYSRWLLVDLPSDKVWSLSKEFFRGYGFKIEKENQQIGIFETDYLEIETKVPEKSLGVFRTALAKALKTRYGLPIADKYRIRIEPIDSQKKSEIYLTLSSIGEVVNGEMRLWQPRDKDVELETEMLLKLMLFLGANESKAISQIEKNTEKKTNNVKVAKSETGFASLVFPYNRKETWRLLGWSLDELGIDIEDRDSIDGSYFIKFEPSKGFFSKLVNTTSSIKIFQLYIKEVSGSSSEVYFVDLSQENKEDSIEYSFELFNNISIKF